MQSLKLCQESITKRRLVTFQYIDMNGINTNRTVEPYQLHFSEMSWYLKGFCLQRQSYRTFKLSRIEHLTMNEETYLARDYALEQERETGYQPELVAIKAIISPIIKDQFIERFGRKSVEVYPSNSYLANIDVPQNSIGFQFLASFGTNLEVIEPRAYIDEFRHYLYQMVEKYS